MGPWQLAPFVCYDLRFPEIFRRAAQLGANLMVVIANWPVVRIDHWTALLAARAIENQAYVVGLNRTGRDPHLVYSGRSVVFDPHGRVVTQLDDRPGLLDGRSSIWARWNAIATTFRRCAIYGRSSCRSCRSRSAADCPDRRTLASASPHINQRQAVANRTGGRHDDRLLKGDRSELPITPGQAMRAAALEAEEILLVARRFPKWHPGLHRPSRAARDHRP